MSSHSFHLKTKIRANRLAQSGPQRTQGAVFLVLVLGLFSSWPRYALAFDLHGNARVYDGATENDGVSGDQLDQKYTLNLEQALTPWLDLRISFRSTKFRMSTDEGGDFDRSSDEPRFELVYRRPTLDARLSYQDRRNRGSNTNDNLDQSLLSGLLRWTPTKGPSYMLRLEEASNVADSALFGRDVDSSAVDFETIWDRRSWGARYSFHSSSVDNRSSSLRIDEDRHQLRAYFDRKLWNDRLALSSSGWISRRDQNHQMSATAETARPLPVREGLFALDTTPEVGELAEVPALVDGDLETPVAPPIDIGAANTFRNVGVDLGVSRQTTRLEIVVDAPSDRGLRWEVYQSPDNLSWFAVEAVESDFDGALLRYGIRFPETTARYFKAVNVTINSFSRVAVTEVRALLDVDRLSLQEGRSSTYRADLNARFRPNQKVSADINLSVGNDEDLAGGLLSRDLDELTYGALLSFDLTSTLTVRMGYRFTSVDELGELPLERDEETWTTVVDWSPLPTVDGVLAFSHRDEKEGERLLRSADTVRLRARTELLPQFDLVSEVTWSSIDDPFSGFEQEVWRWRETFGVFLWERLRLRGSVSQSFFESTGVVVIDARSSADLEAGWKVAPFLSLTGDWGWAEDDLQRTLTERYGVFWAPGPKLTASFSYQQTDATKVRKTTSVGGTFNYRLRPKLTPYVSFAHSTFRQAGLGVSDNTSLRAGFNLFF